MRPNAASPSETGREPRGDLVAGQLTFRSLARHVLPARLRAALRAPVQPQEEFRSIWYQRHNQRRQEHLASLGLPLAGRSVLEVGAGIGDHTSFFLDRGCSVTVTEARDDNVEVLQTRYPHLDVRRLDLDDPDPTFADESEIVYCYGTLYHLSRPAEAIAFMAARCTSLLLLETCVLPGADASLKAVDEQRDRVTQSFSGRGCLPTRLWVRNSLAEHFPHVYLTRTQPWHPEFPLDWSAPSDPSPRQLTRAVFVAARTPLVNEQLTIEIPMLNTRH